MDVVVYSSHAGRRLTLRTIALNPLFQNFKASMQICLALYFIFTRFLSASTFMYIYIFRFQNVMNEFLKKQSSNVNFCFWWHYLDMVSILLMFTRAQRDGIWDLHLFSFRCMLPYFMRYDHTNYARWGPIYLAEMHQLPAEVLEVLKKGNFVVKRSAADFNQVSPDQAHEWLNATGKKGGGVVGITKTASALSRWALSYNLRSHVAAETAVMFNCTMDDSLVHKEGGKSRENTTTKRRTHFTQH